MQLSFRIFTFFLLILFQENMVSQDLIYLNNGTKFEAKVKEITPQEIKYKNANNPDGPTYVISRRDVLHLEYQNGSVEIINKNPENLSPKANTPTAGQPKPEKKPIDFYYINKNVLQINALALVNSDIALMYERDFANNHLSVSVLGSYNFNRITNYTNAFLTSLPNTKKNYDVGLGVNFFPSTRKRSQYFVGLFVKYLNYSFDKEITVQEIIGGLPYDKIIIQKAEGYQLATMIVNGFQVRITPTITYKAFVGMGTHSSNSELKNELIESGHSVLPKMYLGICLGYRF